MKLVIYILIIVILFFSFMMFISSEGLNMIYGSWQSSKDNSCEDVVFLNNRFGKSEDKVFYLTYDAFGSRRCNILENALPESFMAIKKRVRLINAISVLEIMPKMMKGYTMQHKRR